jgi:DDB1- and CUL4-associated factor 13
LGRFHIRQAQFIQFVRDCLEVLRVGAGLDNGRRVRRGDLDEWKYIYIEEDWGLENHTLPSHVRMGHGSGLHVPENVVVSEPDRRWVGDTGLRKKRGVSWEPPLALPASLTSKPYSSLSSPCDEDYPRIFHMFWTGPFTDKPYTALLSFLYTQNVGIHLHGNPAEATVCRPQFWFWINPGPVAAKPNPSAIPEMYDELKSNPWSAPFLHPRFRGIIHFKLWNLTEQLDSVPELKDDWRTSKVLLNSGGHKFKVPNLKNPDLSAQGSTASSEGAESTGRADIFTRVGSKSADTVDKLSTVMSDMARFILCHRFGGVYLDADSLLLRDWEELWGWKGAFAYRWSRLPDYNTAVLRLHKNSALGTFLLRTAVKNEFDFHPMSIARYINQAYMHNLLFRVPDALFDPAWLSVEIRYQRDRPPQPVFDR